MWRVTQGLCVRYTGRKDDENIASRLIARPLSSESAKQKEDTRLLLLKMYGHLGQADLSPWPEESSFCGVEGQEGGQ